MAYAIEEEEKEVCLPEGKLPEFYKSSKQNCLRLRV